MAKDNDNTKLWIGTGLRLGEIKDVLNEDTADLGSLCKSSNINIWAKYKPFRNGAKFFATVADYEQALADANYGIDKVTLSAQLSFGVSDSTAPLWSNAIYNRPRGISNNEFYRALDFADPTASSVKGYSQVVGPPLKIEFPASIEQSLTAILVKTGGAVSSATDDAVRIPISAALPSSHLSNYNIGILFKATNSGGSFFNLLVTDKTVDTLANNTITTIGFTGINDGQTPLIPMFDGSSSIGRVYDGDQVSTRVCLVSGQAPVSPATYKVITSGGASLMSLQMTSGMDEEVLTFRELTSINGMTGTFVVEVTRQSNLDSQGLKAYRVDKIKLENLNPGPTWGDTTTGLTAVNIVAQLNVDGVAWMWSSDGSVPVGEPYFGYITVTAANTGNGYAQIALDADDVNVSRDVYSAGSTAMSNPYIFISIGTSQVTFKVKGYAFKPPVDTGRGQVQLTEGSTTI